MDEDTFDGSVCQGLDLAARLAAEVTEARRQLLAAEQQYRAAAQGTTHTRVPLGVRRDLRLCQHRLRVLDRICNDLTERGDHSRSA